MARVIVMSDSPDLYHGIEEGNVIMIEEVEPAHLEDEQTSLQIIERLAWAVRGVPAAHESYLNVPRS